MLRTARHAVVGVAVALAFTACGGGGDGSDRSDPGREVVVGASNFPESRLLGELYAQALEAAGIPVTRKFDLASREQYYGQVASGAVTVMPEYNGALLTTSVDESSTSGTTREINMALKERLPPTLTILNSSPAEDKDSVTVNAATARTYHLKSIEDLKPVARRLTIAAPPEFRTREQGLVGLGNWYGLRFKRFLPMRANARPATLIKLMRSNRVQVADLFTTDPAIAANRFVILTDPQNVFSAQNITPLVYKPAATTALSNALNAVSARLTTGDLRAMLTRLTIHRAPIEAVARDWLK